MAVSQKQRSLYPVVRTLRAIGWVILVVVVAYLALAGYSVVRLSPKGSGGGQSFTVTPQGNLQITAQVNLSNPGYFSFSGLALTAIVSLPNSNATWIQGNSSPVSLPSQGRGQLAVIFAVPLGTLGPAQALLTHDSHLNLTEFVNGTYATFIGFSVENRQNLSWGAPFEGLQITPRSATPQPNGTVAVSINLQFANHASFAIVGMIQTEIRARGGALCTTLNFPVNAMPQMSVDATETGYVSSGCTLSGGQIDSTYQAPLYSILLPPQGIP